MKITLSVPIKNPDGFVDVEAEFLFDLAPHLASVATFAVHKDPRGLDWNVTNVETGLWISRRMHRADALHDARHVLHDKTPRKMLLAYKNVPKMYPQLANEIG